MPAKGSGQASAIRDPEKCCTGALAQSRPEITLRHLVTRRPGATIPHRQMIPGSFTAWVSELALDLTAFVARQ